MNRFACIAAILALGAVLSTAAADDPDKPQPSPKPYGKKLEKVDVIPHEWKASPAARTTPAAIDERLFKLLKQEGLQPAPLTTDEQFLRRVTLDLTGKVPTPAEARAFLADKSANKRSTLIDRLLASDDFNKHWARYWRDVVTARATEQRSRINEPNFEAWLAGEMKKNTPWSTMVTEMLTAEGELRYAGGSDSKDSGAEYFLLTHLGADAAVERAADTARVFMGIQIQCAQCHDHPSDIWKREQFHELAAFFARTKERPVREEKRLVGFRLFGAPVGEHRMPDLHDPTKSRAMEPRFLTGEKPSAGRFYPDERRRQQLAQFVTSGVDYWFYANMANRVWAELMGQGFYNPVDNMGPLQEATYPDLLLQLAQHFKATDTDIRGLYRVILNTQAYQRQIRLGESADQHLHFASSYPSRLSADEVWNSLAVVFEGTLQLPPGAMRAQRAPGKAAGPAQRVLRRFGFEGIFKQVFAHDPTAKQDEIESTIPQALLLMNNPLVQNKLRANGDTVLAKILRTHTNDRDTVEALYLKVLARTPTLGEARTCLNYIRKSPRRSEAYEDLFWVLLNSAEFQTKR